MPDKIIESYQKAFSNVHQMITEAKDKSWQQVNHRRISRYWNIGKFFSKKALNHGWDQGVLQEALYHILAQDGGIR